MSDLLRIVYSIFSLKMTFFTPWIINRIEQLSLQRRDISDFTFLRLWIWQSMCSKYWVAGLCWRSWWDVVREAAAQQIAASSSTTIKTPTVSLSTPGGTSCASSFSDTDAFGNIRFQPSTWTTSWGCLVVDQANSQPVVSGTKSVRVELRPGDCDASQTFLSGSTVVSDCSSDRSRFEIHQRSTGSTVGQIITYEYYVYIPAQSNYQPPWSKTGSSPLTVLTQVNWQCGAVACP